ncbi:helix-turn-helix domain-containing protein [Bacillus thuringiensis]
MSKKPYSMEFKKDVLLAYKTGEYTFQEICSKYKITVASLKEWMK